MDSADVDQLRELEESLWRAETRYDRGYMDRVVDYDERQVSNRSSLWVLSDGRWRLRFHQGTPATRE